MEEKDRGRNPDEVAAEKATSRRTFLKKCGIAVLATAAYEVISVVMPGSVAEAVVYGPGCTASCITNSNQPDPPKVPPPTCACISSCISSCTSNCQVNCTGCISSSTTAK